MKTQSDYVNTLQHLKLSQELLTESPSTDKAIAYNKSIAKTMEILDNGGSMADQIFQHE